jgi:hypothetical protein
VPDTPGSRRGVRLDRSMTGEKLKLASYWGVTPDDPRWDEVMCHAQEVIDDAAAGDTVSQTELRCAERCAAPPDSPSERP